MLLLLQSFLAIKVALVMFIRQWNAKVLLVHTSLLFSTTGIQPVIAACLSTSMSEHRQEVICITHSGNVVALPVLAFLPVLFVIGEFRFGKLL